jgi:3-deoxy-7-phosphoheptulonate synthase
MMIVMQQGATEEQVLHVIERIQQAGARAHPSRGEFVTVIGAIGDDRQIVAQLQLEGEPGVEKVVPILKPYKLVSSDFRGSDATVDVAGRRIGGGFFGLIAGPCAVESREQTLASARACKAAGATHLRGGAYKPRTSPYAFSGLGKPGLEILAEAREETGLPIVTEVMDPRQLEDVLEVADMIQLGARNMQNFDLLREVGRSDRPVLLKRGMSATIEEWLLSAEYIAREGNADIVLCERGIRTFETSTRYTLDLNAIPVVKKLSHLPIFVDPSHGTGHWEYVSAMAKAGLAAGADGLIIEVHNNPAEALSDGPQSLKPNKFAQLMAELRPLAQVLGRTL